MEEEELDGILGTSSSASTQIFISVSYTGSQARNFKLQLGKFGGWNVWGEVAPLPPPTHTVD